MLILQLSKNSFLAMALALVLCLQAYAGTKIVSRSDGLRIEYMPEAIEPVLVDDDGVHITVKNCDLIRETGQPETPLRILTVAIPPYANPKVNVATVEGGKSWIGNFPVYKDLQQESDPTITSTAHFLNQTLGKPQIRTFAGVRTIRIPIYPALSKSNPQRIELAARIVLDIDFNVDQNRKNEIKVIQRSSNELNRLAEGVLLNVDQAKQWNRVRTANFDEPSWPQGFLYKFHIESEGVYRLTYEDIRGKGVNIPDAGIPSSQLKLFGTGGFALPDDPSAPAQVGLKECALFVDDGGDGTFGSGDWLAFYGKQAGGWHLDTALTWQRLTWQRRMNPYDTKNTYWFNIDPAGNGKRMAAIDIEQAPDTTVSSAPSRVYHESDVFIYGRSNFVGSGRIWYAYTFDGASRFSQTIDVPSPNLDVLMKLRLRLVNGLSGSYGSASPVVEVRINNNYLAEFRPEVYYNLVGSVEAFEVDGDFVKQGLNSISFAQERQNTKSLFDWLDLQYHINLNVPCFFESIPYTGIVRYEFNDLNDPWVFEVGNHENVGFQRGSILTVHTDPAEPNRYILTNTNRFKPVQSSFTEYFPPERDLGDLWSQSNRIDIALITPDGYWEVLEPLMEFYGRREPPLRAARVRLSEIYNRFSGGLLDPAAIRNFLHYTVNYWEKAPDYVLFCGDGDYNYRDVGRAETQNFVPPYEDLGSSRCTDDWFVDFNYSDYSGFLPELIHSRFTAKNSYELNSMIEKVLAYVEEPEFGTWRNRVTLVADDEVGESTNTEDEHIIVQEELSNIYLPSSIDKVKIYLTEYDRELGREKPQSGDDLIENINRGTLLVNYMGHGNPTLWAHEHVFVQSRDLPRIERSKRTPLFVAFTCDWAYWDEPSAQSFPEQLLAMRDGGAIGAVASTRLTYAFSNSNLARNFFGILFGADRPTIAEALARAKNQARIQLGPTYHLLGEPTIYLANPRLTGELQMPEPYPLRPLALSSIQGVVKDEQGRLMPDFSGEFEFLVQDTEIDRVYVIKWYNNDGEQTRPLHYKMPGSLVYRGMFNVENGSIDGQFVVPLDVTMGGERGRMIGYYHNGEIDGVMVIDSVQFAESALDVSDAVPPEIDIFFDHRGYRTGDKIGSEPVLIVDVQDSSGLNLTKRMGHGISVSIDGAAPLDLTENFSYHLNSYTAGSLEKEIGPLTAGKHNLEVIAWDSFNNFAIKEIEVEVIQDNGDLIIDRILNYPNPFNETTQLTFATNKPVDYEIRIFTVNGVKIWSHNGFASRPGIVTDAVWNARDNSGRTIGNGVYIYKVKATDDEGNRAEGIGRIAYVR